MSSEETSLLRDLLFRWQAFSEIQQLAFEFLAAEAIAAGQEFERSTDGATGILTQLGHVEPDDKARMMGEIFQVVQHLQSADRSRQGLEQVASVLTTLRREHAVLVEASRQPEILSVDNSLRENWISSMAENISLADWRRRLISALRGQPLEIAESVPSDLDDELF